MEGQTMIEVFSFIAFAGLVASQVLAIIAVHAARQEQDATGREIEYEGVQLWNTWLFA
jgi:hypothetical protein